MAFRSSADLRGFQTDLLSWFGVRSQERSHRRRGSTGLLGLAKVSPASSSMIVSQPCCWSDSCMPAKRLRFRQNADSKSSLGKRPPPVVGRPDGAEDADDRFVAAKQFVSIKKRYESSPAIFKTELLNRTRNGQLFLRRKASGHWAECVSLGHFVLWDTDSPTPSVWAV